MFNNIGPRPPDYFYASSETKKKNDRHLQLVFFLHDPLLFQQFLDLLFPGSRPQSSSYFCKKNIEAVVINEFGRRMVGYLYSSLYIT
jgi:hypothetical protein